MPQLPPKQLESMIDNKSSVRLGPFNEDHPLLVKQVMNQEPMVPYIEGINIE